MRKFSSRGYRVTVVFDGATPPAKRSTSVDRTRKREESAAAARRLVDDGGDITEVNRLAASACVFDGRINARLAAQLRQLELCEVYIAPGEADAQLVLLQEMHIAEGATVFVYATDSDLIVLGVKSLLYQVSERNRQLSGMVISSDLLFQPTPAALQQSTAAHSFLRQLHGAPKDHNPEATATPLPEATARIMLLFYSMVVGNDYAKFHNIGPAAAARLLLRVSPYIPQAVLEGMEPSLSVATIIGELAEGVLSESGMEDTDGARTEVDDRLMAAYSMFRHPVVWDPLADELRHLSGIGSTAGIARHTGQSVANRLCIDMRKSSHIIPTGIMPTMGWLGSCSCRVLPTSLVCLRL